MNAISFTPQLTRRYRHSHADLTKETPKRFKDKNTFEFVEPHMKGTLSRKKSVCDDTLSVLSFSGENESKPVKKRRLSRMNSLSVFLSPAKQMRKVGNIMLTRAKSAANLSESPFNTVDFSSPTIRSNSLRSSYRQKDDDHYALRMREDLSDGSNASRLSRNRPGSSRKKTSHESFKRGRPWIEKFCEDKRPFIAAEMSYWERERQEAIYELYKGEKYLVKDLEMVVQAYKNSLICLKILKSSEAENIFGPIDTLLPLHKELKSKIKEAKDSETKTVASVGEILNNWVGQLESVYIPYLSNQTQAKQLLDSKRASCKNLEQFLDLCIQSEFSRRLDLWNFLDVPRSKLMKYPLLLKSILKHTPEGHDDKDFLPQVISKIEEVIKIVDKRTGEANCQYLLQKLQFTEERQREPFLYQAKTILCQGELKNNRGTKLYGFLFDSGFLLTRLVEDNTGITYKAHKQPISAYNLLFQDVNEEGRSGSFKSTFSFTNKVFTGKNIFQVSSKTESECFVLLASNEHDKQEWLQRLRDVTDALVSPNVETPREEQNEANTSKESNEENYFASKKRKNKDRTSMRSKAFSNTPVTEMQQPSSKVSTPTSNDEEVNVATPKSVIKKGFESCRSLLRQRSNKSLNSPMEAPASLKRRRLSGAKKLLKEAHNLSPTS